MVVFVTVLQLLPLAVLGEINLCSLAHARFEMGGEMEQTQIQLVYVFKENSTR